MENACKGWKILNAEDFRDINPGDRILMGPGPSDVPARTLQAIASPCIGHLDPYFLAIMNEVQQQLRFLFQTENELTIPVSGTGSAGMETCFVNLVEPEDEVVVCVNGVFGTRMADIVNRIGGKLIRIDAEWGTAIDPRALKNAIEGKKPKLWPWSMPKPQPAYANPLRTWPGSATMPARFFWWTPSRRWGACPLPSMI